MRSIAAPVSAMATAVTLFALLLSAVGSTVRADELLAITTDFSTGSLSSLQLDPDFDPTLDVADLCADAVARSYGGLFYVVNRDCGNIQVLDPEDSFAVVREFSVGSNSNPQDIAFVSATRAYVSRYEDEWLLEVNPASGAIVDSISLAEFADADGVPEMHRMHIDGDELYVQIQRLNRLDGSFEPVPPSWLAVVDVTTNAVLDLDSVEPGVQGIELSTTNPVAPMTLDLATGDLLVPMAGSFFGAPDGAIERINLQYKRSDGFAVTEATLGGNLSHFAQWSATRAYAVVSDAAFVTHLVAFDPTTGMSLGTVSTSSGFHYFDCVTHSGGDYLYLADRNPIDPGVRIFDAATGAPVDGPIPTGLGPIELHIWRPATSGVNGEANAGFAFDGSPWPNPSTTQVFFSLLQPGSDRNLVRSLAVFDVGGSLVRTLQTNAESWDRRDEAGRVVPAGRYFLRARSASGAEDVRPITLLR